MALSNRLPTSRVLVIGIRCTARTQHRNESTVRVRCLDESVIQTRQEVCVGSLAEPLKLSIQIDAGIPVTRSAAREVGLENKWPRQRGVKCSLMKAVED